MMVDKSESYNQLLNSIVNATEKFASSSVDPQNRKVLVEQGFEKAALSEATKMRYINYVLDRTAPTVDYKIQILIYNALETMDRLKNLDVVNVNEYKDTLKEALDNCPVKINMDALVQYFEVKQAYHDYLDLGLETDQTKQLDLSEKLAINREARHKINEAYEENGLVSLTQKNRHIELGIEAKELYKEMSELQSSRRLFINAREYDSEVDQRPKVSKLRFFQHLPKKAEAAQYPSSNILKDEGAKKTRHPRLDTFDDENVQDSWAKSVKAAKVIREVSKKPQPK